MVDLIFNTAVQLVELELWPYCQKGSKCQAFNMPGFYCCKILFIHTIQEILGERFLCTVWCMRLGLDTASIYSGMIKYA